MDHGSNVGVGTSAARRNLLPAVACTIGIAAVSLWPRPPEPPPVFLFPHADKCVHAVIYAIYVAVLAWTYRAGGRTWRAGAALVAYGAVFGAAMELLQAAVPALERTLSGLDMLANLLGSAAGIALYGAIHRWTLHDRTEETA